MWSPIKKKAAPAGGEVYGAPIPRIVSAIIHQAIRENASSIQLVPTEEGTRVEYLKDGAWHQSAIRSNYLKEGIWHQTMLMPKYLEPAITAHLKEMAGLPPEYRMAMQGLILIRSSSGAQVLDIDEVPVPTASLQPGERDYDVHLFITPTRQGEKITLNIEAVGGSPE